jgi:hypothetical protein
MGRALSREEQTQVLHLRLEEAMAIGNVSPGYSFYVLDSSDETVGVYFVSKDEEPTEDEEGFLQELLRGTDFTYMYAHPEPSADRVVDCPFLKVTKEVCAAALTFLKWWDETAYFTEKNPPVLIFSGALITVREDYEREPYNVALLCFPAYDGAIDDARPQAQANFATTLINLVNRRLDVVMNGLQIKDVIPNTSSKKLLSEYRYEFGRGDVAIIPDLIDAVITRKQNELDRLRIWRSNPDSFLPEGMEALDATNGILVSFSEGVVTIATDDEDDLPADILERLRDLLNE